MRILLIAILYAVFFCRCASDTGPFRVQIEFDSTFLASIVEDLEYEQEGLIIDRPKRIFDSVSQRYLSVWDSAAGGEYSVWIGTIFMEDQTTEFEVHSDTTVWIQNQLKLHFVDSITYNDLLDADTVEFIHVSSGCFHYEIHKTIFIRTKNGYKVREINPDATLQAMEWTASKAEGEGRLREISSIQSDILEFIRENEGNMQTSTSHQTYFIRADQSVHVFHDPGNNFDCAAFPRMK